MEEPFLKNNKLYFISSCAKQNNTYTSLCRPSFYYTRKN